MIVLDTNVLSEFTRPAPEPAVVAWLDSIRPESVSTTAINAFEMRLGVAMLPGGVRRQQLEGAVSAQLATFGDRILPFDEASAVLCARIVARRRDRGRPIAVQDAQIAAITRSHGFTLATRNIRDFADTGILLVDPWAP